VRRVWPWLLGAGGLVLFLAAGRKGSQKSLDPSGLESLDLPPAPVPAPKPGPKSEPEPVPEPSTPSYDFPEGDPSWAFGIAPVDSNEEADFAGSLLGLQRQPTPTELHELDYARYPIHGTHVKGQHGTSYVAINRPLEGPDNYVVLNYWVRLADDSGTEEYYRWGLLADQGNALAAAQHLIELFSAYMNDPRGVGSPYRPAPLWSRGS